jgi:putative oxidoreductase
MTAPPQLSRYTATLDSRRQTIGRQCTTVVDSLHQRGIALLRWALGGVYIWFGVLKLMGRSPAADLVLGTIPFRTGSWVVPVLGGLEVVLGLWVLTGLGMRWALPVLVGHLLATFGVLVVTPDVAFQGRDPLMLTMAGEFVVKNLILLAAVIVVTTAGAPGTGRLAAKTGEEAA